MKRILGLFLALVLLLACVPVMSASAVDNNTLVFDFLDHMNQQRANYNAQALEMDKDLMAAAAIRAKELATRFEHTRPNGTNFDTVSSKAGGECIYYEYGYSNESQSPKRAMDWFMNSTPHRTTLMDKAYRSAGVAVYKSGSYVYYEVLVSTSVASPKVNRNGSTTQPGNTVAGFRDVSATDYFAPAVQWAVRKGITSGTSSTTFSPNAACTRAQIVTFLWRAAGSPNPSSYRNNFTDVHSGDFYYKAVLWAVNKGITTGTSGSTFSPNQSCSRAEAMAFLWRYKGSPNYGTSNAFWDVPSNAWFAKPVAWGVANNITNGIGTYYFGPYESCTRGQIVTFLYRAIR